MDLLGYLFALIPIAFVLLLVYWLISDIREAISPPSEPSSELPDKCAVRGQGLVFDSLVLVIVVAVFHNAFLSTPTVPVKVVWAIVIGMALGLAIALAPLFLYIWINGWRGVMAAKGKIATISVIVVLRLVVEIQCIVRYLSR